MEVKLLKYRASPIKSNMVFFDIELVGLGITIKGCVAKKKKNFFFANIPFMETQDGKKLYTVVCFNDNEIYKQIVERLREIAINEIPIETYKVIPKPKPKVQAKPKQQLQQKNFNHKPKYEVPRTAYRPQVKRVYYRVQG